MLINYKNDYEKIMMGLLSFVPDLKEVSRLKAEIKWYQSEENRRLYLWSNEETTDFIGMLGIEIEPEMVLLRHISINPSFRKEGISFRMLQELDEKLPDRKIIGTLETAPIIAKWEHHKENTDKPNELT